MVGTQGSGREVSMRCKGVVPRRRGPVGAGSVSWVDGPGKVGDGAGVGDDAGAACCPVACVALLISRPAGSASPASSAVRRAIVLSSWFGFTEFIPFYD